jgi:hypothetical protein
MDSAAEHIGLHLHQWVIAAGPAIVFLDVKAEV